MKKILSLIMAFVLMNGLIICPAMAADAVDTSEYTVSVFSDGGESSMTIDKWDVGTAGATTSTVTDGVLIPGGDYAGSTLYITTPVITENLTNYVAEVTGVINGGYHTDGAIRLKTVDGTPYYFVVRRNGASSNYKYYGITTNLAGTSNTDVTWVAGPYSTSYSSAADSAVWKFAVVDDIIEVYKNGSLLLSYQNEELKNGTGSFGAVFRRNNSTATSITSGTVKLSSVNILRQKKAEEKYTVSAFSDGGEGTMNLDKWDVGTRAYTTTSVDGGILSPSGSYTEGTNVYIVSPKNLSLTNYIAETTGVIQGEYLINGSIRLKTVGTTDYYFLSKRDGAGKYYYGITNVGYGYQNSEITWLTGPTEHTADKTSANWKFVVIDDKIEVYKNGTQLISYTNEELKNGTGAFGAGYWRKNASGSATYRPVQLSYVNILREETEEDGGEYTVTGIPESGNVSNADGGVQRIEIVSTKTGLAGRIRESVKLVDSEGNDVTSVMMFSGKTAAIPVGALTSNTKYTLSFTPETDEFYSVTFQTGEIISDQNVASGITPEKITDTDAVSYVIDLTYSYDLDSVSVSGTDVVGAEVLLTRDGTFAEAKMTSLGEVTESGAVMEITGDAIGRYRYIVVRKATDFTVTEISANVSGESLKGEKLKTRKLGGESVDMRFASFSDLHNISSVSNSTLNTVMSGFDALSKDIDAMALVGDIVYWSPSTTTDDETTTDVEEDIEIMKGRYKVLSDALNSYGYNNKQNSKTDGKETVWIIGNHEYAEAYSDYTVRVEKTDKIVEECIGYYDIHTEVNGYHMIGAALNENLRISLAKAEWIEQEVDKAIEDDPNKPIFVFTHVKTPDTVLYPSQNSTNYWSGAEEVLARLKEKPQVIIISGHEHTAAQLPVNIGQDGFTQIMLGVTGGGYLNKDFGTENADSGNIADTVYHPQGIIAEVKNNVAYFYRVDLKDQAVIGEPWVIDTEGLVSGQEKEKYTPERYKKANAPYFEENAVDMVTAVKSGNYLAVTFPQAKVEATSGDGFAAAYEIHVKHNKSGEDIVVYSNVSDFWLMNEKVSMAETTTLNVPYPAYLNGHNASVEIYAVSPYLKYSEPLTIEFSVENDSGLTEEELSKQKPEADIFSADFYNGTVTDSIRNIEPSVTDLVQLVGLPKGEKYHFFNGLNSLSYTVSDAPTESYTLETAFNAPVVQRKQASGTVEHRLIGTDAHNLSLDESSYLVYNYTVGGTKNSLKCSVPKKAWIHAAASLSETAAKLYVDGRLVAEASVSGTADSFGTDIKMGTNTFASVLHGRVYGEELTIGEIDKLMTETDKILDGNDSGAIVLLSENKPFTTLTGTYHANSGDESVLTDGTVSGQNDNGTLLYMNSLSADIKIDLGKYYELESFVIYASANYANHRYNLNIQASSEEADSDTSKRTTLYTVPTGTAMNGGKDVKGVPIYVAVPEGTGPVRYIYLNRSVTSFALILAEFQVFGKELNEDKANRIDFAEYNENNEISSVTVVTDETASDTCNILIAQYDENGKLLTIETNANISLNNDGNQQKIEIENSPALVSGQMQKVFIWNDTLKPVTDYYGVK